MTQETRVRPFSQIGRSPIGKHLSESWQWYVLLLPALIYVGIFSYGPMYGIQIAFRDYRPTRGMFGSTWVGMKHFIRFLQYPGFWKMITNTLSITIYSLCTFPCPIIFALMLNEVILHPKYKKSVQMITYAPHFLSEVIVCSLVYMLLDRGNGPINNVISALGGDRISFMTSPGMFPSIYVWSGVWQGLGWNSILYISALSSISTEVIEAAKIDGANRLQIIRHVNIPGILPTICITFILATGGLLSVGYSKIFLLQNDLNIEASQVISTYVYKTGLLGAQYSYSTAIGLFNSLVNVAVLIIVNQIVKRLSETSLF